MIPCVSYVLQCDNNNGIIPYHDFCHVIDNKGKKWGGREEEAIAGSPISLLVNSPTPSSMVCSDKLLAAAAIKITSRPILSLERIFLLKLLLPLYTQGDSIYTCTPTHTCVIHCTGSIMHGHALTQPPTLSKAHIHTHSCTHMDTYITWTHAHTHNTQHIDVYDQEKINGVKMRKRLILYIFTWRGSLPIDSIYSYSLPYKHKISRDMILWFSQSIWQLWNFHPQNFIGKNLACINWGTGYTQTVTFDTCKWL